MTPKKTYKGSKTALLLTGGGARAAYQVGVLSAIAKFVPRNHGIPFPILSGTSAGAINTTALACYASCFHLGVKKLEWIWKNLTCDRIYRTNTSAVFNNIFSGFAAGFQADYALKKPRSLLDNAPLRDLLNQVIDFKRIDKNILNHYLSSLSITASSYSSGDSVTFYQSARNITPWVRAKRLSQACQIDSEHLMASAAIPLVFPSVKIRHQHYGDGSIHQLSPLSPPIHLGAKRIFIIGVEQPKQPVHPMENNPHPPTLATVAGHMLDSVFSDTLQSDLERMNRMNNTLALIDPKLRAKHSGLNRIDSFMLNPSHDFNALAAEYYDYLPIGVRLMLRSVGVKNDPEASLLSYLLFDKHYCRELIKLGFNDAMAQEQDIRNFLALTNKSE
ncbi:patatin-like phospholipase family protein [Thalassotalea euphylliae]|uniref:Patatin-like phospholipase family protein n=1 Tax=Thalassotalea euphylliae TaxID=1655234 RepID=A0A3E0TS13_9GAMM|nr:patatin-like phospholipase family protein [Thalassotalea euphylliae]REL27431.1 patatin-like phospholipase family protein [Thalassotalea euphylliae]